MFEEDEDENDLLQDKRLSAHNNPSTLVLHHLNTLKNRLKIKTQINTQMLAIKTKI